MRSLSAIAQEIRSDWSNVNFAAKPYLDAMSGLESVNSRYGVEDGRTMVLYFLSNASGWRGDTAKRVKAELKSLLKR